jgi:hypothetical protein
MEDGTRKSLTFRGQYSKAPLTRGFGYFRYLVSNYQYHPSFLSLEELGVERKVSQMEATRLS